MPVPNRKSKGFRLNMGRALLPGEAPLVNQVLFS